MSSYGRNSSPAGQPQQSWQSPQSGSPQTTNSHAESALAGNNDADRANDDAPPPYSAVADPAFEQSADANMSAPYVAQGQAASRPPPQQQQNDYPPHMPPRPQQSGSNNNMSYGQTPFPPPPQRLQPHRLQGGNAGYPGSRTYSYSGDRGGGGSQRGGKLGSSSPQPPPGPPPQHRQQQHHPPPHRQQPNVPWVYPPGYHCYKCQNTGVKLKNGKQCQDCYGRFARQNAHIRMAPAFGAAGSSGSSFRSLIPSFGLAPPQPMMYNAGGPGGPLVLAPGDPRIGGIECGRCRGRGMLSDLLGDYTCSTCRGIGRLL